MSMQGISATMIDVDGVAPMAKWDEESAEEPTLYGGWRSGGPPSGKPPTLSFSPPNLQSRLFHGQNGLRGRARPACELILRLGLTRARRRGSKDYDSGCMSTVRETRVRYPRLDEVFFDNFSCESMDLIRTVQRKYFNTRFLLQLREWDGHLTEES
jgi:hypothetical protein